MVLMRRFGFCKRIHLQADNVISLFFISLIMASCISVETCRFKTIQHTTKMWPILSPGVCLPLSDVPRKSAVVFASNIRGVSKQFGEWYQKINKTEDKTN
jgi:hypothetical protein